MSGRSAVTVVADAAYGHHTTLPVQIWVSQMSTANTKSNASVGVSSQESVGFVALVATHNDIASLDNLHELPVELARRVVSFDVSFNALVEVDDISAMKSDDVSAADCGDKHEAGESKRPNSVLAALQSLPLLEVLDASHNTIPLLRNLHASVGSALQILKLRSCRLRALPSELFVGAIRPDATSLREALPLKWPNLREVDLYDNELVDTSELFAVWTLESLDLGKNSIADLFPNVSGRSCAIAETLSKFSGGNDSGSDETSGDAGSTDTLDGVCGPVFESTAGHQHSLKNLSLCNNLIKSLPLRQLRAFGCLTNLDLSSNKIRTLPFKFGKCCPRLSMIGISQNKLGAQEFWHTLMRMPALQGADLSYNNIDALPAEQLLHDASLNVTRWMQLNLLGNKLQQDDYRWLADKLPQLSIRLPGEIDLPSNIIDGLWLGSFYASLDRHNLEKIGVTHVLTVANALPPPHPKRFKYHVISLEDVDDSQLLPHWDECHRFISEGIAAGGVLVHCAAGISRSASTVMAYLMKERHMTAIAARELVRERRPIVCPNQGFLQQLEDYEGMIGIRRGRLSRLRSLFSRGSKQQ